jgi:MFS family permease
LVIGGFAAAIVLLPLFVLVETRQRAPMLDLRIFRDRLFAAASAAALFNGLSRFALLFVFVFYFQGPQGDSPIVAGIKLAPMAAAMLVASPLAGVISDRRGSRTLAAAGMVITAVGLALMTTLQAHTPYWQSAVWLGLVGIGSGAFNSPNTAAMMGVVPEYRRGIAAATRTMVQNTGAVVSIAFVLAIITAAVPKDTLFQIFSGLASGLPTSRLDPFISNMHVALWTMAAISVVGAVISLLRPSTSAEAARDDAAEALTRKRPQADGQQARELEREALARLERALVGDGERPHRSEREALARLERELISAGEGAR